jgi:hypothetical protein
MATRTDQPTELLKRLKQCFEMAARARLAALYGEETANAVQWNSEWRDDTIAHVRLGDVLAPQNHARTGLDDE